MARWRGEYPKLSTREGYFIEGAARSEITFEGWQFWIFIDSKGPQLFYCTELTVEVHFEHRLTVENTFVFDFLEYTTKVESL